VNRALYAAATGMAAQQRNLDVVANNLANADVTGFKGTQVSFAALAGGALLGTVESGVRTSFAPGKLMKSGGPFDVAIDGEGFFQIERDGRRAYTRAGSFARAVDGTLRNAEGWRLCEIRIPKDAVAVSVTPDGRVEADTGGYDRRALGRIRLATFPAPEHLRAIGSAAFVPTGRSGGGREIAAGGDHGPKLEFGMLEKSNVSIVESMMAILAAQRAYEANAKGVQAADEMLRIANNIHRS
jgi:flagellar basal-body rod protein FlgG